jgi:hypothetical protein
VAWCPKASSTPDVGACGNRRHAGGRPPPEAFITHRRDVMTHDWSKDVKRYVADPDEAAIKGIVRYCGIALQSRDASFVACTDKAERDRVRDHFLKRKLAVDGMMTGSTRRSWIFAGRCMPTATSRGSPSTTCWPRSSISSRSCTDRTASVGPPLRGRRAITWEVGQDVDRSHAENVKRALDSSFGAQRC